MTETVKPSVEGICLKIFCLSTEHARKVKDKTNVILKESGLGELPLPLNVPNNRKVWCYPVQLAVPCPRLPVVEYLPDRDQAMLRFHGDTLSINTTHLQKLVSVFVTQFRLSLYSVLLREMSNFKFQIVILFKLQ